MYEAIRDMNYRWRGRQETGDVPSPLHGASRSPATAQGFWSSELDAQSQPDLQTAADILGQFLVPTEAEDANTLMAVEEQGTTTAV